MTIRQKQRGKESQRLWKEVDVLNDHKGFCVLHKWEFEHNVVHEVMGKGWVGGCGSVVRYEHIYSNLEG